MKILADDKIPLVKELFGKHAEIRQKPGSTITQNDLSDIDILLVRTVTAVNQALLDNTNVGFVGSATAGIDHLDTDYLNRAGIQYFSAKGANARAVVNYVQACIAALQKAHKLPEKPRVGIIGVGEVGSRLAACLENLKFGLVLNDPLRAAEETTFTSSPLEEFTDLDLISVHTPLTKNGSFPTYHLLNESFLKKINPRCVLINTARGGVVDEQALLNLKQLPTLCWDVWENEPRINLELMQQCFIATPHIAGYSSDAKNSATQMLYQNFQKCFQWPELNIDEASIKPIPLNRDEVLTHYNPQQDTEIMRFSLLNKTENLAEAFEKLRRDYTLRKEF